MVDFIHNNKDRYGVEAICRILPIAASTYYRALDLVDIQINSGWVYTAFIIDVFSRAIVGWKVSTRINTDMVLDALEQALHDRGHAKECDSSFRQRCAISFHSLY